MFGCTTTNDGVIVGISAIDTYNINGGERQNVGDSGSVLCVVCSCNLVKFGSFLKTTSLILLHLAIR